MSSLLHISDIHFGPPHWPRAAEGLLALAADRMPNLVVISGDLTQRAKPVQFREARSFVDRIEQLGIPTVTVPGNHDVPLYRVWERLLAPLGTYRNNFSRQLEPTYQDGELLVVGVNSAHGLTFTEGRVRAARIREVGEVVASAPEHLAKIVTVHHHLLPPPRFGKQNTLINAPAMVATLARAGVELVLSGHYHQAYFGNVDEFYHQVAAPFWVLSAGTGSSRRGRAAERGICSCFWIDIQPGSFEVEHLRHRRGDQGFAVWARHSLPRRGRHTPVSD